MKPGFLELVRSTGHRARVRVDEIACILESEEKRGTGKIQVLVLQLRNNVVINIVGETWESLFEKMCAAAGTRLTCIKAAEIPEGHILEEA